jgi:membrane protein
MVPVRASQWWGEATRLLQLVRARLRGRDLALIAAGLTFYAGLAIVPLLVVAVALTARLTSEATVVRLGNRLVELLPGAVGAPAAVGRLVDAGVHLSLWGGLLALLPMSLYGEGLRRALLRFGRQEDTLTGWRGRALALPLLLVTPLLLYPLLLAVGVMADLARDGGAGATVGRIAVGFYSVLAALTVPLLWGFRVVAAQRLGRRALLIGVPFTAACLSGFLQGFVLFLSLPLDLGAPFGGLTVVGGVVAIGLWLFLLHLVLLGGWLLTQALDDRFRDRAGSAGAALPAAREHGRTRRYRGAGDVGG